MLDRLISFILSLIIVAPPVPIVSPLPTPIPLPPTHYIPQQITYNSILSQDHSWTATLSAQKVTTVITTGDVMLGRSINAKAAASKNFSYPFSEVSGFLNSADLTFVNLENPIVKGCPVINDGFKFCADPRFLPFLTQAGIDAVNLANNHAANFGATGLKDTLRYLESASILAAGVSGPVYFAAPNARIGILGFNDVGGPYQGISQAADEGIKAGINTACSRSDIVIVQFHWGSEYTTTVTGRQRRFARLAIDSGADLVIGNHPHWVQPLEIYKGKLIVYSQGNFIFDQSWSLKTMQGLSGKFTFFDSLLVDAHFFPVVISPEGRPEIVSFALGRSIMEVLSP